MTDGPQHDSAQQPTDTAGSTGGAAASPAAAAATPTEPIALPDAPLQQPTAAISMQPTAVLPPVPIPAPQADPAPGDRPPLDAWRRPVQPASPYAAPPYSPVPMAVTSSVPGATPPVAAPGGTAAPAHHGLSALFPADGVQPSAVPSGGQPVSPAPWDPQVAVTEAASVDGSGPRRDRRRRGSRLWVPVVAAAAIAAVIASLGTAALVKQISTDSNASTTVSSTTQLGTSGSSSVSVPVTSSTAENPDWQTVASTVAPTVVSIQVTTGTSAAEGSGVIVDSEGDILTNNHVVTGATNDTVQVTLQDGRIYQATVVGTDATTDLAVVKIKNAPDDLKSAVFADSDEVIVGEPVMAVGNPLGLSNTVTTGIVSALNRPVSTSETNGSDLVVTNAIQIDAAVNPGNSGGPLFNASGEVIGITSSIASLSSTSESAGSIGLGFAIPANQANLIGGQLIKSGTAEHAYLGVTLSDSTATAEGTTRQGAQVESVLTGSPAEDAKLQKGDVIVGIDGNPVSGAESLTAFVRAKASGATAKLTLVRDGKSLDVTVTLATRDDSATAQSGSSGDSGSGSSGDSGSGSGGDSGSGSSGDSGSGSSDGSQGLTPTNPWDQQGGSDQQGSDQG